MRARLAWGLWLTFVITLVVATYYGFNPETGDPITLVDALWAWSFLGFPTAGALIASRFPRRPLGWLFILGPLAIMLGVLLSDQAATAGFVPDLGAWSAWLANVLFSAGLATLMVVPFYLPNGSREGRLKVPFWIVIGTIAVWMFAAAFAPGPLVEFPEFTNPVGIEPLGGFLDLAQDLLGPVLFLSFFVGIASLVLRFTRAQGQERLQLKCIALGAAAVPLVFAGIFLVEMLFGDLTDTQVTVPMVLGILSLPISVGIAMLKHRLFEIDQVINRTLVYSVVTAALVGVYLLLVFALQRLLDPVTGDADVAVAGSTLAVAALFRPIRNRIQAFIDRRFYRRKYDARRSLEKMGKHLRDEVAIETVCMDVLATVHNTIQPSHAGLWLRPSER